MPKNAVYHVLHADAQRRNEDKAYTGSFLHDRAIEIHGPRLVLDWRWWSLHLRPLGHEICEYLGLDRAARSIRDILSHQLECPLGDPPFGLRVLNDLPERILVHHDDGMRIELASELALGHQDRVHEFLHL
jgi:hypothetical protein